MKILRKLFLLSSCIFLLTGCTILENNKQDYNINNIENENSIKNKNSKDKNSQTEQGMNDFDSLVGDFAPLH
ncbi:hypothetical protein [Massilimicrobiota timonensis]|uniref:hypothetical protein n=1 Tax=Massilimicrobiota timonensis TaxID=1776392 RepID=UPI00101DED97|nr:hypothetical protein [Massilimicrobiota timonensis]